jgi:hypothetical protein
VSRVVTGLPGAVPTSGAPSGTIGGPLAITSGVITTPTDKNLGQTPTLPAAATNNAVAGFCPLVRITLGSQVNYTLFFF